MDWTKSSYSNGNGGSNCVEIAKCCGLHVLVRDSKAGGSGEPILTFTRAEWLAFLAGVKAGEFDDV